MMRPLQDICVLDFSTLLPGPFATLMLAEAGAQVIVTMNLKDFVPLPPGIEALSPDEFLGDLLDLDPDGMLELLTEQAAALKRPARTLDEILAALSRLVPNFAAEVTKRRKP